MYLICSSDHKSENIFVKKLGLSEDAGLQR